MKPGQRFGPWEVVRELGRGGMGAVLEVRHVERGTVGALKRLLGASADADQRERFLREARVCAALRHPALVRVHDLGWEQGEPWLVMDLVQGESLAARLKREGPLPAAEVARLGARLARALAHVHAAGALHRDVKPANVILGPDGPVLVDFGLARSGAPSPLSRAGQLLGTPAFMSPEQADGRVSELDGRTDVYGLGATLYALLCGHAPFEGTPLAMISAVLTKPPDPPSAKGPPIDPSLERIVLRCLEKAPADRYATAEALANHLELWAPPRPARRAPAPLLAAAVLLLGLLAAGGLLLAGRTGAPPPPSPPAPPSAGSPAPGPGQEPALQRARELFEEWLRDSTIRREVDRPALRQAVVDAVGADPDGADAIALEALLSLAGPGPSRKPGQRERELVSRALERGRDRSGLAWIAGAQLLHLEGQATPEGVHALDEALELAPDSFSCRFLALRCSVPLVKAGLLSPETARARARAAAERWPNVPNLLLDAGYVIKECARPDGQPPLLPQREAEAWLDEALELYDRALALDPGHVRTLIERGWARHLRGDREGGLADLDRAIELAPENQHARKIRGLIER